MNKGLSAVVKQCSVAVSLNKLKALRRWSRFAATQLEIASSRMTIQRLEDDHQKKLQKTGAEVNHLQASQADLERQIGVHLQKEKEYKDTIKKLNDRKRQADEGCKDSYDDSKDSSSDFKVKELELEHQELVDRLAAIEDNVVNFISEMSNLLETHESTMHRQPERSSKKRTTLTNIAAFK